MLVRPVSYTSSIDMSQVYLFTTFEVSYFLEEASYCLEKSGLRLIRRCRGVLGD